jgi:hypothetical protein
MLRSAIVCAVFAAACGGAPASEPDAGASPIPELPTFAPYLRVVVHRTAAGVILGEVETVQAVEHASPHLDGDLGLVAKRGGQAVSVQAFALPTTIEGDGLGDDGARVRDVAPIDDGATALLIPAADGLDELEVIDAQGASLATAPVVSHAAAPADPIAGVAGLIPGAPSIVVVSPSAKAALPLSVSIRFEQMLDFADVQPATRARILEELSHVEPRTLAAVSHILVGTLAPAYRRPTVAVTATTSGSFLSIYVDQVERTSAYGTLIHECAHAYANLLGEEGPHDRTWQWDPALVLLAQQTMHDHLTNAGFMQLWSMTHDTAVDEQLSAAYSNSEDAWQSLAAADAARQGFAMPYGSKDVKEDIATYVEALQVPGKNPEPAFCAGLRGATQTFARELALPLVDIELLKSAGFLSPSSAAACTGGTVLQGPVGLHFRDASGGEAISVGGGVKGGWIDEDGGQFLIVLGEGADYLSSIRVEAPGHVPPLGVHRLDNVGFSWQKGRSMLLLGSTTDKKKDRTSASGIVVVTEVSATRITGAILFLAVQDKSGNVTGSYPIVTFHSGT